MIGRRRARWKRGRTPPRTRAFGCRATALRCARAMAAAALLLPAASSAQREINPDCALVDGRFRVELVNEGVCCPKRLVYLVQGQDEPAADELIVDTQLEKIFTVRLIADSCLVTTGRRHGGGNVILIADLLNQREPMQIDSYAHRFSPSKRKLVYATYYEPDAPEEDRRSILALLDFDAAAERATEPSGASPIYPPANVEAESFDPSLEPPHVLRSPILFSGDESEIVFLELFEGALRLVSVALEGERVPILSPSRYPDGVGFHPLDLRYSRSSSAEGRCFQTTTADTWPFHVES